MLFWRLCYLEY